MNETTERSATTWRRCSVCKTDIALGAVHWVCSVSTCNRKRTALVFCNVDCWEVHPEMERHREAYAVEARAPKTLDPPESPASERAESRPRAKPAPAKPRAQSFLVRKTRDADAAAPSAARPMSPQPGDDDEILVVASRLKAYVKATSGFSTSDRVLPRLSTALRRLCDEAIDNAREAERLTVMDRDVPHD